MVKYKKKMKYTRGGELELVMRRDSDFSDQDMSEDTSDLSSVEEDAFFQGVDVLEKPTDGLDPEEEPARKKCRMDESTTGFGVEEDCKGIARGGGARGRAQASPPGVERWRGVDELDVTPPQPSFRPLRTPGCQLIMTASYSAVELFQLFFTNTSLLTILQNTNENGRAHYSTPSKPWVDLTLQDMFSFLSVVIYMSFVRHTSLTDYWRGGNLYSLPFPQKVISGKEWLRILKALHLSSAEDDAANEAKRGTPAFDRLGKVKPLYQDMKEACRQNYHPGQEISIDERTVASKASVVFKQYMGHKCFRQGFKLFVLADSRNGYLWDFCVYKGRTESTSDKALGYHIVTRLMDTSVLGTGYKLFVKSFYTSPKLFLDLLQQKIWACGTIRPNSAGLPKTKPRALDTRSSRRTTQWLRKGPLVFLHWQDTRELFLVSTFHTAHGDDTVRRKMKDAKGRWSFKNVPVPPAVKDFNRCMKGVEISDALIGNYQVLHETRKWYKMFFYHFVDIAVLNAFLLHKELCGAQGRAPVNLKAFRESLAEQLMVLGSHRETPGSSLEPPDPSKEQHRLVYISSDRTDGRLKCRLCHAKTAVKCSKCDKPLCFVPQRDCYNTWHTKTTSGHGWT